MRRMEEQHPECSFAGARMLSMMLTREGRTVGLTLMKRIGLHALYRKPNTSKRQLARQVVPVSAVPFGDHPIKPCLGG